MRRAASRFGRVSVIKDTKVPNAATLVIEREDHTLGNTLRHILLEDKEVLFAGYRQPHPLEPAIQVKVQTRSDDPGPVGAVQQGLTRLMHECDILTERFDAELDRFRKEQREKAAAAGQAGPSSSNS